MRRSRLGVLEIGPPPQTVSHRRVVNRLTHLLDMPAARQIAEDIRG